MPDRGRWRLAAPAKLNLWLHVTGRREDGFHELVTALVLLELEDALAVEATGASGNLELALDGPYADQAPSDPENLAWRGWEAGQGGAAAEATMTLSKAIPVAAGMGGGSSDAAAAWRLGRRVAGLDDDPPPAEALAELARIGADVPFFAAQAAAARVTGIGERVEPLTRPAASEVVLVEPPFGLATADVFGALQPRDWSAADPALAAEPERNDLLAAARRLRPEIDDVFRIVAGAGGAPSLTGSGPTVFVLTDDPERAAGVTTRVARAGLTAIQTRVRAEPASIETW
ncbi:MAG TPA: 4-(cytidine 5'-diphospho)-2-C-methyl-D-erythritol kinase [Candidatus Limnocylindria bacterium]|jgi:4-diphosphocytidyl-2-C-methyl-D-erythritol kinase